MLYLINRETMLFNPPFLVLQVHYTMITDACQYANSLFEDAFSHIYHLFYEVAIFLFFILHYLASRIFAYIFILPHALHISSFVSLP